MNSRIMNRDNLFVVFCDKTVGDMEGESRSACCRLGYRIVDRG